jgi:hypothetical protein
MSAFSAMLARHEGQATCNFRWVGKVLGHRGSDEILVDYIDLLIDQAGFPRPLPHRKHGGGLETGVAPRSEWIRAGVIDWLGNYLPPSAAAALDDAAEAAAAEAMDAAASDLRLVFSNDREVA